MRVGGGEGNVTEVGGRYDDEYAAGGGAGGGGGVQASLVASDVVHVSLSEPLDVVGGAVRTTHAYQPSMPYPTIDFLTHLITHPPSSNSFFPIPFLSASSYITTGHVRGQSCGCGCHRRCRC